METYGLSDAMMQMGGIITKVEDGAITMDLKGRLGNMKIPMRMLITDYELKVGQEVRFTMSFPTVISAEPNEKYLNKSSFERGGETQC